MYIKCLYVKKAIPHFVLICFLYRHLHIRYILFLMKRALNWEREGGKWTDKDGSVFFHFSKAINIWKYENNVKVVTKGQCNAHFLSDDFCEILHALLILVLCCSNDQSDTGCLRKFSVFWKLFRFLKTVPYNKPFKKYIKKTSH